MVKRETSTSVVRDKKGNIKKIITTQVGGSGGTTTISTPTRSGGTRSKTYVSGKPSEVVSRDLSVKASGTSIEQTAQEAQQKQQAQDIAKQQRQATERQTLPQPIQRDATFTRDAQGQTYVQYAGQTPQPVPASQLPREVNRELRRQQDELDATDRRTGTSDRISDSSGSVGVGGVFGAQEVEGSGKTQFTKISDIFSAPEILAKKSEIARTEGKTTTAILLGTASVPLRYAKGFTTGVISVFKPSTYVQLYKDITNPKETREKLYGLGEEIYRDPGKSAEIAGEFRGFAKGVETIPKLVPKVEFSKGQVPVQLKESAVEGQFAKVERVSQKAGTDVIAPIENVPRVQQYSTIGIRTPQILEKVGVLKKTPVVTKVTTEVGIKGGELVTIKRTPRGTFKQVEVAKPGEIKTELVFGSKGITGKVKPGEINVPEGVPAPAEAVSYEVFNRQLILRSAEKARQIETLPKVAERVQFEKGLPVKEFELNIEGLKRPKKATEIVSKDIIGDEGVIFGSLLTKQLPKKTPLELPISNRVAELLGEQPGRLKVSEGFWTKAGDVDIIFPDLKVSQIAPRLEKGVPKLQRAGELIEVSPQGTNVLQFKKPSKVAGEKFLEAKSGIDQEILGLGDTAPVGIAGFQFPNLKAGQVGSVVKFGEVKAITAGEQTLRKLAGSSIVSPGKLPGETTAFSQAGVLGKQGNPRGLKDVAVGILQMKGIAEIKKARLSPIERARGAEVERLAESYFKSFTPEQQADIVKKLRNVVENPAEFEKLVVNPLKEVKTEATTQARFKPTSPIRTEGVKEVEISPSAFKSPTTKFSPSPAVVSVSPSPTISPISWPTSRKIQKNTPEIIHTSKTEKHSHQL